MEGDGEGDWELLAAELLDARNETAGGVDDAPRADADQVWVRKAPHGFHHRRIVRHRFAHAHEDDVRKAPAFGREHADRVERLLDDLVRPEVAAKRELASGAERTADGAAGLRGDTEGRPVWIAHHNLPNAVTAIQLVKRFGGAPMIGLPHRHRPQGGDAKL